VQALGTKLLDGRLFNETDRAGSEPVVLLNETAAKRFFPGSKALGARVAAGFPASFATGDDIPSELINPPWATVVGIVSDVRQYGYLSEPQPQMLVPFEQSFDIGGLRNQLALLVRTSGAPEALLANLREVLRGLDPHLPTDSIQTMSSLAENSVRPQRFVALLLGIFAGIAAVLSAIGIYSVVSWSVAQRTREVGIRLALGASPGTVISRIVRQGLTPVLIGVGCGLLAALTLTRLIGSQLVQVKSYDPITYVVVAALLGLVALLACWIPARRVSRVDPMAALRTE
jgi:predicted permease